MAGFKKVWRVKKVMKMRMAAGATEEVNITYRINRVLIGLKS